MRPMLGSPTRRSRSLVGRGLRQGGLWVTLALWLGMRNVDTSEAIMPFMIGLTDEHVLVNTSLHRCQLASDLKWAVT
jgi:hypothetical protein